MRWLIIERLKPPHHPRQCYVLCCDSEPKGPFLGITVWQTEQWPDTARVGTTRYRGRPLLGTPPVVPDACTHPGWKPDYASALAESTRELTRVQELKTAALLADDEDKCNNVRFNYPCQYPQCGCMHDSLPSWGTGPVPPR
jgi:hypothetical protein